MWQHWVNVVLGAWVLIIPNVGMSVMAVRDWEIASGIAIIIFAIWGALSYEPKK